MQAANLKNTLSDNLLNKFYVWKIIILLYIFFILSLGVTIYLFDNTAKKITNDYKEFTVKAVHKLNILTEIRKNILIIENATIKHISLTEEQQMSHENDLISTINNNQNNILKYKNYISTPQELKLYNELVKERAESIISTEKILFLSNKNRDSEAIDLYNTNHLKKFNKLFLSKTSSANSFSVDVARACKKFSDSSFNVS